MSASLLILAFVTLQRLAELVIAKRNTLALLARGAREAGGDHYAYMVCLHAAWLGGLWLLAPGKPVHFGWVGLFLLLQALRVWVLVTLKGRWTTRIIILPGETLVRAGPYRLLNHPNYVIVAGEIAALPLAFGMPAYAMLFFILNAAMLAIRIRVENAALRGQ